MANPEPIFDVARGDAATSRQLGAALRTLAENTRDPALRALTQDVLGGRMGVRDFARTEVISKLLDSAMPAMLKRIEALSDEERELLAEQGRADLERYRQQSAEKPDPTPRNSWGTETTPQPWATPAAEPETGTNPVSPPSAGGTRRRGRDVVVTPDEPDDDDLYFEHRRRHGWLE
ncbi:hypothetical protein [Nocardia grenadensis]|uniref:hypothetical protein n=1 Tax=Nocardia grenadensis TaxID=931537 RepID=UPI0007A377A2|nr:hypothetical protein [Nocardia grenadensis]